MTEYLFSTPGIAGGAGIAGGGGAASSGGLSASGFFDRAVLGLDIACFPDLDPELRLIGGRLVLAQDLLHRFETPEGGLWYDLSYGYDLRALLLSAIEEADAPRIEARIAAQARLDERVLDLSVAVTFSRATETLRITMGVETEEGPFTMVLGVDRVTAQLLEIR